MHVISFVTRLGKDSLFSSFLSLPRQTMVGWERRCRFVAAVSASRNIP